MRHFNKLLLSAALALQALLAACATGPGTATRYSSSSATPAGVSSSAEPASAANTPGAKLDSEGYIHNWLVLAPINFGSTYNAEDIDKDQIPNEANLTPKACDKQTVKSEETVGGATKMIDKQITWAPTATTYHVLDFNALLKLETSDSFGGYAFVYLVAPEEMKDITFSLCSNDDGKIFLNGQAIWKYVGGRASKKTPTKSTTSPSTKAPTPSSSNAGTTPPTGKPASASSTKPANQ